MAPRGRGIGIMAPATRPRRRSRGWQPGPRRGNRGYTELELVALAAFGYSVFHGAWVACVFAGILALLLWFAFVRPTSCDVENKSGRGSCENIAYGALRACYLPAHRRAKRDALWAYVGLRNPGQRLRITWSRNQSPTGRRSPVPSSTPPTLTRPLYDGLMLAATVASAAATVIALVVQL